MKLSDALVASNAIVATLLPDCARIEVAGSIRRAEEEPGDIDLVLIPNGKRPPLSFGQKNPIFVTMIELSLWELCQSGHLKALAGGEKYKKFELDLTKWGCDYATAQIVKMQVTIATPANWAYWFLIRTGPAAFSRWIVTPKTEGGAIPHGITYHEFGIWKNGEQIPTPDEEQWLAALGLPFIHPSERANWKRS